MRAWQVRATLRDDAGHTHDVVTTASHPFWVVGEDAFVDIVDIPVGAALLGSDGGAVTLVGKAWQYADVPVYNFEVEGQHNYFAAGVLGHNGPTCTTCVSLGPLSSYVTQALENGYAYLLVPDEVYQAANAAGTWWSDSNLPFIDKWADEGATFVTSVPYDESKAGKWFQKEVEHLMDNRGYTFGPDNRTLSPPCK